MDRKGIAVTELAVCLPVLVLIVLGTIEACNYIFLKQTLAIAAYEGARVSILPDATQSDVDFQCREVLNGRGVQNPTVMISPSDIQSQPFGSFIAVQVSAPYVDNRIFAVPWFSPPHTITRVEMMKEN